MQIRWKFRSDNAESTFAKELGMLLVQVEAAELSQALATGVESFIYLIKFWL